MLNVPSLRVVNVRADTTLYVLIYGEFPDASRFLLAGLTSIRTGQRNRWPTQPQKKEVPAFVHRRTAKRRNSQSSEIVSEYKKTTVASCRFRTDR